MQKTEKRGMMYRAFLALFIGIAIVTTAFLIAVRTDTYNAQRMMQTNIGYIKEQTNRYARIELALETKSLMRVTESCKQIAHQLADEGGLTSEDAMARYARDNYVSGLLLLSEEGEILAEHHSEQTLPEEMRETVTSHALLGTASHPEKRYAVRFRCDDGSELDVAATAREDTHGVVVAYYHTTAEYRESFSLSVTALVSGYRTENGETIVISSGDTVVASNDTSLVGKSTNDSPILKEIYTAYTKGNLAYASETEEKTFPFCFGTMESGRDFYIYSYMPSRTVFRTTPWVLLFTIIIYLSVFGGIIASKRRIEQRYREERLAAQEKYAADLQSKNEELSAAVDRADRASAAKTGFLSRMSHDIRTPLNGIIGLLEIDAAHPENRELIDANRGKMRVAADHLLSLINDILQMSKLESGEITLAHEAFDLAGLLDDVMLMVEPRAAEFGVTMTEDGDSEPLDVRWVYGSPLHLRQIFLNIYTNCIKYNKIGGRIRTRIQRLGAKEGHVTYRFVISDTGIGMSREFLSHIFDPFTQEKTDDRSVYQGTGLGMTIVKGLVERMGGTITVESEEGVGSSFTITIPFEIAEAKTAAPSDTVANDASIRGVKVLLAEDNALNAEIATVLLTDAGAVVTAVTDGRQAVDLFRSEPAGTFDVILMDVMMPVMDGLRATRLIRATDREDAKTIPILAMTANAFAEEAVKCMEAGMNAHLAKPVDIRKLVETIHRFTGKEK